MLYNIISLQALDLWMAGCMLFVFAALAEFVVVKVLDIRYQAAKSAKTELTTTMVYIHTYRTYNS